MVDVNRPGTILGAYSQDEGLFPWLLLNAGAPIDHNDLRSRDPRIGVVLLPRQQTAIKGLHGQLPAAQVLRAVLLSEMQDRMLDPEDYETLKGCWRNTSPAVSAQPYRVRYRARVNHRQGSAENRDRAIRLLPELGVGSRLRLEADGSQAGGG